MAHYELSPQKEFFLFLFCPSLHFSCILVLFLTPLTALLPPLMGPSPGTPQEFSAPINSEPTQTSPGRGAELQCSSSIHFFGIILMFNPVRDFALQSFCTHLQELQYPLSLSLKQSWLLRAAIHCSPQKTLQQIKPQSKEHSNIHCAPASTELITKLWLLHKTLTYIKAAFVCGGFILFIFLMSFVKKIFT